MLEFFLSVLFISLIFETESLNIFFDYFVIIYTVLIILLLALYLYFNFDSNELDKYFDTNRIYRYSKKHGKSVEKLTWKQKFEGKWEKIFQEGFHDVIL
jgi:hypothetical protein